MSYLDGPIPGLDRAQRAYDNEMPEDYHRGDYDERCVECDELLDDCDCEIEEED